MKSFLEINHQTNDCLQLNIFWIRNFAWMFLGVQMVIHVTILMITLKLWTRRHETIYSYIYVDLKSDLNPAKRIYFIMEENASMISQLNLEVLKIIKSSWTILRTSKLSIRDFNFVYVSIKLYLILSPPQQPRV